MGWDAVEITWGGTTFIADDCAPVPAYVNMFITYLGLLTVSINRVIFNCYQLEIDMVLGMLCSKELQPV